MELSCVNPSHMQSNPITGHFLMSYTKGLSLSFPKLASIERKPYMSVTAGYRQSFTDGLIGNCRPLKLLGNNELGIMNEIFYHFYFKLW
jgi:hypothetical protein